MVEDVRDVAEYYDGSLEQEDLRLERHRLEYDLTWRYLERYLPAQGNILEVGAATGRYTVELARRGYGLTAVDLSAGLLERCGQRLREAGLEEKVRRAVADARDLGSVTERNFDAALLMGPLYHLGLEADRRQALKEAHDRLKEGGVIFSAFISRLGAVGDLLKNMPGWIEDQREVWSLVENGKRPDDYPRGGFRGYFARAEELRPLHEAAGFETLAVAGVEPCIAADDESYNALDDRRRALWLELLDKISTDESTLGASRHLLYIGKKRESSET